MKQKVFITGADGMLGMSICRELIKQNYQVKAVILPPGNSRMISHSDMVVVTGNILDKEFIEREMSGCDYVIHAAALTTVWPRRSESVMQTNVEGTRNILEASVKKRIKRLVHIGSASSFDPGPKENPGNETSPYKGWNFRLDYIDSKYMAQELLLKEHLRNGFPVVIINPTYMLGPFDSGPSSGKMVLEVLKSKIWAYSTGGKNFVCSTDVAEASVKALKSGRTGECYIIGGENLNYKELFEKVCKSRNKKLKLLKVPAFLILTIGFISSVIARLTFTHPKLSYTMARVALVRQFYSSRKAERELNYKPTPIERGINSCVSWFETNGYLNGAY